MKRTFFILLFTFLGLYVLLHLLLGSSPVQRRVLAEIRAALATYGIDLQIESIEFSALTPKLYLNRVTLSTNDKSPVKLSAPLAIDKIKIQFQPLALIYRRIVIDEAVLFHPRILVPRADVLYRRIERLIKERSRVAMDTGTFSLVVNKFGVVDALFNVASQDPPLEIRSRSLSAFVANNARQQQTITVESSNLEIDRGPLKVELTKVDFDADVTERSLRVNKGVIEGKDFAINVIGASSLPFREKGPDSFNTSFEVKLPLALLNKVPELKAPALAGLVNATGTLNVQKGFYRGSGSVRYDTITLDGYQLGSGALSYGITDKRLTLTDAILKYGGGEVRTQNLFVDLQDRYPIGGELQTREVKLERILDSVKSYDNPIRLALTGDVKADGFLTGPLAINLNVRQQTKDFLVLKDEKKGNEEKNLVLRVPEAKAEGVLTFTKEKMGFQAELTGLDGKMQTDGFVGFDDSNTIKVRARTESLSLTGLHRIANLRLGGKAALIAEVDVVDSVPRIAGSFDVTEAEVADLSLGKVKGQAFFQNMLLSFENLEMAALEPVRGSGFVDFKPKETHYKFNVDARRVGVDEAFGIFQKRKLGFSVPRSGELIGGRVSIEGGHDEEEIEVKIYGQARNFDFYGERWLSSQFAITYRDAFVELNRVMLLKKLGGLEVKGRFAKKGDTLSFQSHGLRLEELDAIGRAPLTGELTGQVALEGDLKAFPPRGRGEIRLIKMSFRGNPVPDSSLRFQPEGENMEFFASVVGEKLRGRYVRPASQVERGSVMLYFKEFDFAPVLTLAMGKDIPTFTEVSGTGDLSFTGNLADWSTVKGSGTVSQLRLGLRGTPMTNKSPLEIKIQSGAVKVERFHLVGSDSQFSMDYQYQPQKMVKASLDGKVDLQFLQPFIPGLEYGSGKVSAGLRLSGHPSEFELLGNLSLEDGAFRLKGLNDEFRAVQAQLSVSQNKLNVDRFEGTVGGGRVVVYGDVGIARFKALVPNLKISANRVMMRFRNALSVMFSGDFFIRGSKQPFLLGGTCRVHEGSLTKFETPTPATPSFEPPILTFDVNCEAKDRLQVSTDVMDAEFKGNFHLLGTTDELGMLGSAEAIKGSILFRETQFALNSGTVKFESTQAIAPRFNVSGRAVVRETKAFPPQDYEITLQVFGTPADYRLRLTSSPSLTEGDITSLLLLGVTSRSNQGQGQEGNYVDLGTAIAGQIPLQSKFQSELGVDINITTQTVKGEPGTTGGQTPTSGSPQFSTVPSVQIQKGITKQTKLSYSNSIGDAIPIREFKIEHALDDNFTINGTAVDRARTETQSSKSYGLDFRYRFSFE